MCLTMMLIKMFRAVNVVVPNDPSTTTFKELACFLRLLPNLLTIQLLNLQDKFATTFSEAFDYKKCVFTTSANAPDNGHRNLLGRLLSQSKERHCHRVL